MSEYSKFLKHFNKSNNDDVREDVIFVSSKFSSVQNEELNEKEMPIAEKISEKDVEDEIFQPEKTADDESKENNEKKTENADVIPSARFIRKNEASFISVKGKSESDVPTNATKYTDRLLPHIPEKAEVSEIKQTTEKTNTYSDNHTPGENSPKFIPAQNLSQDSFEKVNLKKQTPEATAEHQTKIIPTVVEEEHSDDEPKVIIEKLPDGDGKTKAIAGKGDLLREIAKTSSLRADDDQLTMDGFREQEEEKILSQIAEDEALEEELSAVREKRINSFRFWTKSKEPTGESDDKSFCASKDEKHLPEFLEKIQKKFSHLNTDFVPTGDEEYTEPSRRKEIFSGLIEIRKSVIFKALALAVLGLVLLTVNVVTTISAGIHNGFFTVFGGSTVVYNSVNLIFMAIAGILMADDLKKGLFCVLKIRPKTDTALLFVYLSALLQNIASFFSTAKCESEYHLFTGAVLILCVPLLFAKIFYYDSIRHCFKAVAATSDKCYLRKISDSDLIAALLKDKTSGETNVVYAGKTRFISSFLKRSAACAFSGQASSRIIALTMLISIFAGLISLITTKSIVNALGGLTLCAALSFPVSCVVFTGYMLRNENSALSVKSSFIGGYSDAYNFTCIDDIILDGGDIFWAKVVSSACSDNVNEKQAQFCAAVITNKAGGILKNAFSAFSLGLEDKFPEVEGFAVEDKMGISAWISDCRVLLGTVEYLKNHSVKFPESHTVPFVLGENEKALFLAIEGHFAAVFSVKYDCDESAAKSLCDLAKNGANILISIKDPNITEEFGENLLGLPANSLRIIKSSTNERFCETKNTVTDSEETGIVFSDSFDAFSRTMAAAIRLDKVKRVSKTLCQAMSVGGVLFGFILTVLGAASAIAGWLCVIGQLLILCVSFFVTPTLCTVSLKTKIKLPENVGERIRNISAVKEYSDYEEERDSSNEEVKSVQQNVSAGEDEIPTQVISEIELNEKISFIKKEIENSAADFDASQLMMQGAPYTQPPEIIDFSLISGEEKEDEEPQKQTVSVETIEAFEARHRDRKSERSVSVKREKSGLFGAKTKNSDSFDSSSEKPLRKSILSFLDEKIPAPPKFNLTKNVDEANEDDVLNTKFIPPENDAPTTIYKDDFFASFDKREDDKAFEDVRRKRETFEDEGEFDFWTKK